MALAPLRPTDPSHYGPYRLQGRLGSGGMGVVYLAFGPDNMAVALKVLQPVLAQDEEYRARFVREVGAARLVDSPYVARVVEAETESETLWMATEYVEGATLAHAVETNGPVPGDRLRGLASDLAAALAALHEAGLVHRDLKPANVVLAWSGPKLIDFGIAKHESGTDLTQTGVTVGSLLWMSPEVLAGQSAGRPSDVFAWGLCVGFAGTGKSPFGSGDANAVAFRISSEQPNLRGLDSSLAPLVAATLIKDPRSRPSAQDLCTALRGRGSPPQTAVAMPRADGGWTGPKPTQVAPAPLVQQWAGAPGPPTGPPTGPPPGPPAPRSRRGLVLPLAILAVLLVAAGIVIAILATSNNGKNNAGPPPSPSPSASTSPTPSPSGQSSSPTPTPPPSTAPPTTTAPVLASLQSAEATVMAAGYTPYENSGTFWDPSAPINVILGTLTNSADGFNNWAFFFAGNRYIGHDTSDPQPGDLHRGPHPDGHHLELHAVRAVRPNCCPTGGMQQVRFQWNGSSLTPLDPIPGEDPTKNHR